MASSGWAASRRVAAALLRAGTSSSKWITVFRNAARTSGDDPRPDPTGVLPEGRVPDIVQPVLDLPVRTGEG